MPVNQFVAKSHVLHRALAYEPQKIVSGSGISFTLESGKVVYDASAGPSVSVLGHHQPEVTKAIVDQLDKIAYVYSGSRYTCDAAESLATELLKDAPGGLVKAIFVNSGSEATDAALKLATQYFCEVGQPKRINFIARKQSYHGNTLGALSVSGHESRRAYYRPWIANNVSFVDPCYSYRAKGESETDAQYVERLKLQLEDEFLRLGPDTIMCGMGKTGTMHAWEQEGIRGPDIQMIGKALGGGFVPLSGVLLNQKVFDGLAEGTMVLAHGHTFQAHPTACAAALAVQKIIKRENILDHVASMGRLLEAELNKEIGPLAHVGNIRGRGLFWAVEFMRDAATKTPFPVEHNFSNRIVEVAAELGLNVLGNLGKTGKIDVELVILAPPYIVTEEEIKAIVGILKKAILAVTEEHVVRYGINGFHK
ncbi:hypothetical protein M431DRAFT_120572 [Trichoderma harzianum CBS 226.95]|uniref:PLP-dependent transferase n=1 Tax=Trichoderma harzianum CBS 226.95 TaxID=983964 RepID=A0A2T4A4U4_TRIHA|nr:hypothetical protein M431DRAFT_120572 [Trichoderma harzianum CBS 226.95]PTB52089.1 hypothetical protein M431DRAFT_120572 [Trichoderma harzianum CBS 226.95]